MVRMVSIQEASAHLAELIRALEPGDQIVLTDGARRVGRILPEPARRLGRSAGVCCGSFWMIRSLASRPDKRSKVTTMRFASAQQAIERSLSQSIWASTG